MVGKLSPGGVHGKWTSPAVVKRWLRSERARRYESMGSVNGYVNMPASFTVAKRIGEALPI